MSAKNLIEFDRRTALKWVLAAAAALQMPVSIAEEIAKTAAAKGYGKDPDLLKVYTPGQLWPLTLSAGQRRIVTALSDVILPAEGGWAAASEFGVVEFIDEWISAPYSRMAEDRQLILEGLTWLEKDSKRRFNKNFADLSSEQAERICDDLSGERREGMDRPATFFARFKQLVAAGYYTTPQGMRDLGYVGNVPLAKYDGPPKEVMERIGVSVRNV